MYQHWRFFSTAIWTNHFSRRFLSVHKSPRTLCIMSESSLSFLQIWEPNCITLDILMLFSLDRFTLEFKTSRQLECECLHSNYWCQIVRLSLFIEITIILICLHWILSFSRKYISDAAHFFCNPVNKCFICLYLYYSRAQSVLVRYL